MSGHNCKSIAVIVRTGNTNMARAGHGRDAVTASSTQSAYEAALAAAEKFFQCKRGWIILAYAGEVSGAGSRGVNFFATQHARPVHFLDIEFEDRGQDFLTWEVVAETGQVVNCTPFQYTTWARCCVLGVKKLRVGEHPQVLPPDGEVLTLAYAVTKITRKPSAKSAKSAVKKSGGRR